MANVSLTPKQARVLYSTAEAWFKEILEASFPEGFFSQNIMERVTDVRSACEELGIDYDTRYDTCEDMYEEAEMDIKIVAEALREGQYPGACIWYPYFYNDGSGFRFYGTSYDRAYSDVGARLRVDSEEKSDHLGRIMEKQYIIYLTEPV